MSIDEKEAETVRRYREAIELTKSGVLKWGKRTGREAVKIVSSYDSESIIGP